jgi:hypothetical protein
VLHKKYDNLLASSKSLRRRLARVPAAIEEAEPFPAFLLPPVGGTFCGVPFVVGF